MSTHRLGYQWRYDVRRYMAERGIILNARELGAQGDDLFNEALSIECKNARQIRLPEWMDQCEANAGAKVPILAVKRKGHGTADGYAVMRLEDLTILLNIVNNALAPPG